jgi:outer membrane receptor protein involved in Fe transport
MQPLPRRAALALALLGPFGYTLAQEAEPELPSVTVIATTPLPGLGVARNEVAAAVQTATARDIDRRRALDLGEFMNRSMGSVHVNDVQGNPLQADVNYRGYTASPLLGTPQGLSVYLDGVRMNQPFGDVVSWDLIPRAAIASMTLIPGSNPLFGLNALGGALSIQTKDGRSHPGTSVQLTAGSHARRALEVEHGGSNAQGLHWFFTGNRMQEDGWRTDSASDVQQLFGKLGWQNAQTDLALTLSHADNTLRGNGLQEQRLLERDWRSVYTKPDITGNRSTLLNLSALHEVDDSLTFSGNAYYRRIRSATLNADVNEAALDQSLYQPSAADRAALAAAGYTGFPASGATAANTPFPFWRCIAQSLQGDEPAEKCNGLLNRSTTSQSSYGVSGQFALTNLVAGRRNQFTAGGAYEGSHVGFRQSTQLGYLNPDRSVSGINAFGDGVSGGTIDGLPYDTRVDLGGRTRTWSLFATDTLALNERLHLTLSGRYNRTTVENTDLIHAPGSPESLAGTHHFQRFNPALGLTFSPSKAITAYAGYNEGSRAPSTIELGCANPDRPCKLPNAMAGDPPLKQVVTRTWEAGLHGAWSPDLKWNAGLFRAENSDDILFVADDQAGFGYFKNVGKTRRQGLELGMSGKQGKLSVSANYTLLDATFRSAESFNGSSNSSNSQAAAGNPGVDGIIDVRPGARIPLIPRHLFKLGADWQMNDKLSFGADLLAVSGAYARGNENNAHRPDGVYYLGPGKTSGYAVFNLGGTYAATPQWEWMAQINNLFDRRYATAAQLGPTGFDGNGNFAARPFAAAGGEFPLRHATFYAPGAPRSFWIAVKYSFGKPARRQP